MIYGGYTTNGVLNYAPTPAVTVTVNYGTINGYAPTVPVTSPYGYIAIPDDNSTCIYNGLGDFNASAVTGYTNQLPTDSNVTGLLKGEVALVSKGNYTFHIKNNKLYIVFTNAAMDVINTRVTIDENVNTILIDTIAEIAALETAYNNLVTTFNAFNATFQAHVHSGVMPGTPDQMSGGTTTVFPHNNIYTATSNFTRDQTFLGSDGLNNFVNVNGKLIT